MNTKLASIVLAGTMFTAGTIAGLTVKNFNGTEALSTVETSISNFDTAAKEYVNLAEEVSVLANKLSENHEIHILCTSKKGILDENIYAIQSAPVKGHIKSGKYVSSHIHFDVLYLMEADDRIPLKYKENESKGVKWISFEEADDKTMCDFIRPIHKKIIEKLKSK